MSSPGETPEEWRTCLIRNARRVAIVGPMGAGKTSLALALSESYGISSITMDSLYWQPDWVPTPKAEYQRRVRELVAEERWIIDSASSGDMLHALWERADVVIWLDLSRLVCVWRVMRRTVANARSKVSRWGNVDTWSRLFSRESIVLLALRHHPRSRARIAAAAAGDTTDTRLVRLRRPADVDAFRRWAAR
jgi:adenylate kinase family enzyme